VRERVAILHAQEKLAALGDRLPFPHQSAIAGAAPLRELRPRAGRAPWRAIYARVGARFIVLAVGPEALVDRRGFDRAIDAAQRRLAGLQERGGGESQSRRR
jgi:hypothetical protein